MFDAAAFAAITEGAYIFKIGRSKVISLNALTEA
tara:strand:+ start:919 stop:1020 length:102 start_codon:yes stop_codon:yes gene_type:complete